MRPSRRGFEVIRTDLDGIEAYRVETHDGRTGSVAAVLPRAGEGELGALLVRQGLLSCELAAVPFDAVELVDHEEHRVVLRERAAS
jgi:hypothetical protein